MVATIKVMSGAAMLIIRYLLTRYSSADGCVPAVPCLRFTKLKKIATNGRIIQVNR